MAAHRRTSNPAWLPIAVSWVKRMYWLNILIESHNWYDTFPLENFSRVFKVYALLHLLGINCLEGNNRIF